MKIQLTPLLLKCLIVPLLFEANLSFGYQKCQPIVKQIEHIHSQMRQGYSLEQGERLRTRLIRLQQHRHYCERQAERQWQNEFKKLSKKKQLEALQSFDKMPKNVKAKGGWNATSPSKMRLERLMELQKQQQAALQRLKASGKAQIKDAKTDSDH
jgi:hypothetical protein